MKKNIYLPIISLLLCFMFLAGCAKNNKIEKISLTIWVPSQEEDLTKDAISEFIRIHKSEADFSIKIQPEEIENIKEKMLASDKKSADVFHFASDQYTDLKLAGILSPISCDVSRVTKECGGTSATIVYEASEYSKLYAYPATNSNGYFLYYNKKYFKDSDVLTLDKILSIAKNNKKYFAMDWESGWYLYSFFSAAGKSIKINSAATANICDFNDTQGNYSGLDVANAMLKIARHPGFRNVRSDKLLNAMKDGSIIAVVNGTWNAQYFNQLWGKNCGAVKLPTYTIKHEQLQMGSFSGYKYVGVNKKTKHRSWANKIARWLTTYKYQMVRYKTTGECPANLDAASSYKVQLSAPIAALNQQNQYADMLNVLDPYWPPMEEFGKIMAAGNYLNKDLQELLDKTVEKIQKPIQ